MRLVKEMGLVLNVKALSVQHHRHLIIIINVELAPDSSRSGGACRTTGMHLSPARIIGRLMKKMIPTSRFSRKMVKWLPTQVVASGSGFASILSANFLVFNPRGVELDI